MTFVGAERRAVVAELLAAFDDVVRSGRPRLVSLEAPQGWGKTRIVQSLYEELAARQPDPPYWPPSLIDRAENDPLRLRKRVYPETVDVAGQATLPWMWWALSCGARRTGSLGQVLADDITQLERHHAGLLALAEHTEASREALRGLLLSLMAFVPLLGDALDAGRSVQYLYRAGRDVIRARSAADSMARDAVIDAVDAGRVELVDKVVELMMLTARRGLPFVVVVDDAHDADDSLVTLLERVFAGPLELALLCVCTAWPDRIARQIEEEGEGAPFGDWLSRTVKRDPARCTRRPLSPLDRRDLGELVHVRAPKTDAAVVQAFARRADGNPLVLEGLLQVPRVRRSIREDRVELTPEEVGDLPNSYEGTLRERWEELPDGVREALCLASLQGRDFVEELVLHTYDVMHPDAGAADPGDELGRAINPYAWIRKMGEILRFHEQYALEIAEDGIDGFFSREDVRAAQRALAARIVAWKADPPTWELLSREVETALLGLHVRLAEEGHAEHLGAAGGSARRLATLSLDAGIYREALRLAELARGWSGAEVASSLANSVVLGRSLAALGEYDRSERVLAEAVAEAEQSLPAEDPQLLEAQIERGNALLMLGRPDEALEVVEPAQEIAVRTLDKRHEVVASAGRTLMLALIRGGDLRAGLERVGEVLRAYEEARGAEHPETLQLRVLAGYAYIVRGEATHAGELLDEVLAESRRLLGGEHPTTLEAQTLLAQVMRLGGHPREALELQEATLASYERVLAREHPDAVTVIDDMAETVAELGDLDRARALQEEALVAHERRFGADNMDVIVARGELADIVRGRGDLEEAHALHDRVVRDSERVFGEDHLLTACAYDGLAETLTTLTRLDEAVALREDALKIKEAALGPDDPQALGTRVEIARVLGVMGRLDEARELDEHVVQGYKRLAESREAELGAEHSDVSAAHAGRADALRQLGRPGEASEVYERLLRTQRQVLGTEHPDTLTSLVGLGGSLSEDGEPGEAAALFSEALAAYERLRGVNHLHTANIRSGLAGALVALEAHEEAIDLREEVLRSREMHLGAVHPEVLQARTELAESLRLAGRSPEAVSHAERAAADAGRVLGAESLQALVARREQAASRLAAERPAEAVEGMADVATAYERMLGREHPFTLGAMVDLADVLAGAGKPAEAEGVLREVHDRRREELGPQHPDTRAARLSLAGVLVEAGQVDEAVALHEAAVAELEQELGADDPLVAESRGDLGDLLFSLEAYAEAREPIERTAAELEAALGPDEARTVWAWISVGNVRHTLGDIQAAHDAFAWAAAALQRLGEEESDAGLAALTGVAATLGDLGDLEGARAVMERVVSAAERAYGPEDPETHELRSHLEYLRHPPNDSSGSGGESLIDRLRRLV